MSAQTEVAVPRRRHPGFGKGRAARQPKGRQLVPAAVADVKELLGERPRQRDLLDRVLAFGSGQVSLLVRRASCSVGGGNARTHV